MAFSEYYDGSEWKTELSDVVDFHPATMVESLQPRDRMGAIKALVNRLHGAGYVTDSLRFCNRSGSGRPGEYRCRKRDRVSPCPCRSAAHLGMALGISLHGVDFHSETHPAPVRLICLVAVPAEGDIRYLPLLGYLCGFSMKTLLQLFSSPVRPRK